MSGLHMLLASIYLGIYIVKNSRFMNQYESKFSWSVVRELSTSIYLLRLHAHTCLCSQLAHVNPPDVVPSLTTLTEYLEHLAGTQSRNVYYIESQAETSSDIR